MKEVLQLFVCSLEICIPYWYIGKLVRKRTLIKAINLLWYVCILAWIGLLYYQRISFFYSRWYLLFEIVGTIMLVKWRYKIKWKAIVITVSIFYESLYLIYLMGLIVEGYYCGFEKMVRTQTEITLHRIIISIIALMFILTGVVIIFRLQKKIKSYKSLNGIENIILLIVPVAQHLTLYVCDKAFYSVERIAILRSTFLGTLVCICLISFLIIYNIWKKGEYDIHLLEERADMAEQKYRERIEGDKERDILVHDIQNYLLVIDSMLDNKEIDRAQSYIRKIQINYYSIKQEFYTGNMVVDAILGRKVCEAEKEGISVKIISDDLSNSFISDRDLCSILSNLLDNAIEACQMVKENKYIHISLENSSLGMVWNIENSCLDMQDANKIEKRKEKRKGVRHGTGLRSVRHALKNYDGILVQRRDEHIFKTIIVLYR